MGATRTGCLLDQATDIGWSWWSWPQAQGLRAADTDPSREVRDWTVCKTTRIEVAPDSRVIFDANGAVDDDGQSVKQERLSLQPTVWLVLISA
jgi:hypothetical protein